MRNLTKSRVTSKCLAICWIVRLASIILRKASYGTKAALPTRYASSSCILSQLRNAMFVASTTHIFVGSCPRIRWQISSIKVDLLRSLLCVGLRMTQRRSLPCPPAYPAGVADFVRNGGRFAPEYALMVY